ncbi:MAG: EamA family transporter [Firmicutes bacterium]|nr:EamA family transporter [Bacillota bacterium]
MNNTNKSKLAIISAMTIFGTIGIFRKFIPLPSSFIAMARGYMGALFLIAVVLLKKEKINWESIKKNLLKLIISGGLIGFNWILLFESYQYTTVATATLCYYMAPIFVILVSPFFFKEKLTAKKAICVAVALFGMVLVSGILDAGFSGMSEMKGIIFGLGAAVLYASVVVINKHIKNISAYDKTILQLASAAIVVSPYVFLTEDVGAMTFEPLAVIMLAILGIVHTGIAYFLYFGSMDDLPAQTVALFSYIDPVVAILLSAFVLREGFTIAGIIGAVLVLGSTLISEMPDRKKISS